MSDAPSQPRLRYAPAQEELFADLQVIEDEAYPEPWSTAMFREEMCNINSYFFLAYDQDTLVGYAGFWLLVDDAHITTITTRHDLRGQGYGQEQMVHLINKATQLDAHRMTLEVRPSNAAARKLYTNLGFSEIGLRKGYYSKTREDALVLELRLASS